MQVGEVATPWDGVESVVDEGDDTGASGVSVAGIFWDTLGCKEATEQGDADFIFTEPVADSPGGELFAEETEVLDVNDTLAIGALEGVTDVDELALVFGKTGEGTLTEVPVMGVIDILVLDDVLVIDASTVIAFEGEGVMDTDVVLVGVLNGELLLVGDLVGGAVLDFETALVILSVGVDVMEGVTDVDVVAVDVVDEVVVLVGVIGSE